MLNVDSRQFEYSKYLSWEEVFDLWRQNEANNPMWIERYRSWGFSSWDEWRGQYVQPLKCASRDWHLYRVLHPVQSVPAFFGGPFRAWIERHYGGTTPLTFAQLASLPDVQQRYESIQQLAADFPKETSLIGFVQEGRVTILEGMHRCVAVALAAQQSKVLDTHMYIALADASGEDLPIVGRYTKDKN